MTALSDTGDLIVVRAQLEEEVLAALEGPGQGPGRRQEPQRAASRRIKPAMPPEIILVNNLVRQYLESVGLQRTSSVLVTGTCYNLTRSWYLFDILRIDFNFHAFMNFLFS